MQCDELFAALRERKEDIGIHLLTYYLITSHTYLLTQVLNMLRENTLYREEIEELNEIFFIDDHDKDGYTPLILAAGTRILLTHSLSYLLTYSRTHRL